jgi:hypothetical protein
MLVPGHDSLAFHIYAINVNSALCLAVHFARHERQLVGLGEEDVKSGFELENGFEDRAAAENVKT